MSGFVETAACYRITQADGGFQPEMHYRCFKGDLWVPLNHDGFWAEPHAFSTGEVTKSSVMSEADAKRAVWKARLINKAHRP
jgi:hypothetical protein